MANQEGHWVCRCRWVIETNSQNQHATQGIMLSSQCSKAPANYLRCPSYKKGDIKMVPSSLRKTEQEWRFEERDVGSITVLLRRVSFISVGRRFTCHLHISVPLTSSLHAAKSRPPSFTPSQSPLVSPARSTDPSLPTATALMSSAYSVPSYRTRDGHGG